VQADTALRPLAMALTVGSTVQRQLDLQVTARTAGTEPSPKTVAHQQRLPLSPSGKRRSFISSIPVRHSCRVVAISVCCCGRRQDVLTAVHDAAAAAGDAHAADKKSHISRLEGKHEIQ
jgi:hypothetical protein